MPCLFKIALDWPKFPEIIDQGILANPKFPDQ